MFSRLVVLLIGLSGQAAQLAWSAGEARVPGMVGRAVCAGCHQGQTERFAGSHHDRAMQPATGATVLGDFDDARFTHLGVSSIFYRKDGGYWVRTEGPDGRPADYEVRYTFGVDPLQQYLVELPGGRLQALNLAWDARPAPDGGQRWFHLYPGEPIGHDDELHWTRPAQNWNSMCAECHSTGLRKGYDPATRTFATTWSEIDVSCEACHGPGAAHVAWARGEKSDTPAGGGKGLATALDERRGVTWAIDAATGNATRSRPRTTDREIHTCARCHARRSPITDGYVHGEPFMDHYMPSLLAEGMYFSDGQIDGEAYVYGSFLQSKMYAAGVTCSDCHDPHSLELRAPGNGVCLQCHAAAKYDATGHHHHASGSSGAQCAECHMPPRTYMVVDPRHDHSMRIPRPDLSVRLGVPNACTRCHQDRTDEWAATQVRAWYGDDPGGHQRYAGALAAARAGDPRAGARLAEVARDAQTPAIARATALAALGPHLSPRNFDAVAGGLSDRDPLARATALAALAAAPPELRTRLGLPALEDPVRAVRIEAARTLASLPPGSLSRAQASRLEQGFDEYVRSQKAMAERPEAQVNLGNLYAARSMAPEAEAAYAEALAIDPAFVPAYVNLADHLRSGGEEARAESVLRQGIEAVPGDGSLRHALGLSLVRQGRTAEALAMLEEAARLSPDNPRYVYVYAVALNSTGEPGKAVLVLQGAHHRFPRNAGILNALVAFHRDAGNLEAARVYAGKLRALSP